ncbi:MAG: hypothetical protein RRZ70_02795 [Synergistaceae bacterium]
MMNLSNKIFNLIGLSKRAGRVAVGQDNVFLLIKNPSPMLVIVTDDVSQGVIRKVNTSIERNASKLLILNGITRYDLGQVLGVNAAQIIAYPIDDSFAVKILEENDRGGANE